MTRIFHWFFMWKIDPTSGCEIRLVFTLQPTDSALQFKKYVHLWDLYVIILCTYLSIYLSEPSLHISVYLSFYLPEPWLHTSIYISIDLNFDYIFLSIHLSIYLSIYLSLNLDSSCPNLHNSGPMKSAASWWNTVS